MDRDVLKHLAGGVLDGGSIDKTVNDAGEIVPVDLPSLVRDDGTYSDSMRILAFQLWSYEAAQNIDHTRRLIKDRTGIQVKADTLRAWRDDGDWPTVSAEVHQTFSHESIRQVRATLQAGTVNAVRWLVSVFNDPNVSDTVKFRAAATLLDRGGFPALVRGEFIASHHVDSGAWADVTDAELEERIYQYATDNNAIPPEPEQNDARLTEFANNEHMAQNRRIA